MSDQISNAFYAVEALRDVQIKLNTLLEDVLATLQRIDINLASQTKDSRIEAGDFLEYRKNRNPGGGLSELGKKVMTELLMSGIPDKKVAEKMGFTASGVGYFRREVLKIRKNDNNKS